MKIRRLIRLILTIIAVMAGADEHAASPILSLKTGTEWTYEGTVRWMQEKSNEVRSKRIRWRTWIERSSTKGARTVAIVRGFPFELAWYEPGRKPGYSVIVQDSRHLAVERCESRAEAERVMKDALASDELGDDIVRFPVKLGDCPGNQNPADLRYCWLVEEEIADKRGKGWRIVHRTNPDHQILHVVRGAGITRYVFEHHGTVSSVDVELVQ